MKPQLITKQRLRKKSDSSEYMPPCVFPEPNAESEIDWSPAPGQLRNVCPVVNVRRSSRIAQKAQSSKSFCAMQFVSDDPDTVAEAISGENARHWRVAMQEELHTLSENRTCEFTDLPKDKKAIQMDIQDET